MKKIISCIVIIITLTNCSDRSKFDKSLFDTDPQSLYSSKFQKAISGDSIIEIEVKLIDDLNEITLPAYCGFRPSYTILRYEVVKVNKGNYAENFIFINYMCLRESVESKSLVNDKKYFYKLRRIKDYYEIINRSEDI